MSQRFPVQPAPLPPAPPSGGRLVATDGRPLPLLGAALNAEASGGLARVVLEQRFRNPHPDPLHVTYLLPLPADGAVSGFAFRIGDRHTKGHRPKRNSLS
jgi:Ca-activated chloride channel family protein